MAQGLEIDNIYQQLLQAFERDVLTPLREKFIGKSEIIDLIAVTAIAQENLLILGPPGTAKSDLIATFAAHLHGRYFQYLLTKFTEPNEIFGPIDLNQLRNGIVITNTDGMLPDAEFAFLDEVFNANSAILNSLLTILNERTFRRGRERLNLQLFAVFGATNEIPEDELLRALFDRFLLRVLSDNVSSHQLNSLFEIGWKLEKQRIQNSINGAKNFVNQPAQFTTDNLRQLSQALTTIDLSPIREDYLRLISSIRAAGIEVTDRRLVKLLRAIAAAALLRGKMTASIADLWVLRYIWSNNDQAEVLKELVQKYLDQYLATHPTEKVHELIKPHATLKLSDLTQEFIQIRNDSSKALANVLDIDIVLTRLNALAQRVEWLPPHNHEPTAQKQLLTDIQTLAAQLEAKTASSNGTINNADNRSINEP